MNTPIRVGVLGIGDMGSHHVKNLANEHIVGAKLAALMDPEVSRLQQIGKETGVSLLFEDSKSLLQHPEVDAC